MVGSTEEPRPVRICEIHNPTNADGAAEAANSPAESVHCVRKRSRFTREDYMKALESLSPLLRSISSEEVTTSPLYDVFVNLYLPKIHPGRLSMQMFQSVVARSCSDPASAEATKAVALLILSRTHNTSQLSHAATQMYSKALCRTRQQLSEPHANKITLIGTAHMLTLCELLFSASLDDSGARPHTRWVISLIESYRTSTDFPKTHPLLASPMRLFATWESIIGRQIPNNIRVPTEDAIMRTLGPMATLSDLSIWAASLVGRGDNLCVEETCTNLPYVLGVLQELVQLEGKMHAWMASYYESTTGSLYHFTAAPARCKKGRLPIFPSTYDFPDLENVMLHIGYWMCLLTLVEAKSDILKAYYKMPGIESAFQLVQLEKLATEYADNICMSIPFMSKPDCGWSGRVLAIRPLRFVLLHYKRRGEWQKVGWCVDCAAELRARSKT